MNIYKVELTKSFLVTVRAKTQKDARRICEFYTSDIQDISTSENKEKEKFQIENIECTINDTFGCRKIETT